MAEGREAPTASGLTIPHSALRLVVTLLIAGLGLAMGLLVARLRRERDQYQNQAAEMQDRLLGRWCERSGASRPLLNSIAGSSVGRFDTYRAHQPVSGVRGSAPVSHEVDARRVGPRNEPRWRSARRTNSVSLGPSIEPFYGRHEPSWLRGGSFYSVTLARTSRPVDPGASPGLRGRY